MTALAGLEPNCFYWAMLRKSRERKPQVVRVSTEFGQHPEYWTVVVTGSDEHHMPSDFTFISNAIWPPEVMAFRQAAE